jgi:TetR/AcrR family transcriptional regulator
MNAAGKRKGRKRIGGSGKSKATRTSRTTAKSSVDATSRKTLLEAAKKEFARNGLHGSRVDKIARTAKINKQLIYYYFGAKDNLYLAVLEDVYGDIRAHELALDLRTLDPMAAMRKLVSFTFDYVMENRDFVLLLTNENLMEARHLKRSKIIKATHSPIVDLLADTLKRGEQANLFRSGIDAVQLYISLAGLCFFYSANIHTLGILFDRDLRSQGAVEERRDHVMDFVISFLAKAPSHVRRERHLDT